MQVWWELVSGNPQERIRQVLVLLLFLAFRKRPGYFSRHILILIEM